MEPAHVETRVALIWRNFLPSHHARLSSAGELLCRHGMHLYGIEVVRSRCDHGLRSISAAETYDRLTLFPDATLEDLKQRDVSRAVNNA
jgi:hypothetical protein